MSKLKLRLKRFLKRISFLRPVIEAYRRQKSRSSRSNLARYGLGVAATALGELNGVGVPAFAAFGTLLGCVREGRLIGHDTDIDLAFICRGPEDWLAVESALGNAGCRKIREFAFRGVVTEQAYRLHGCNFDVFGLFPDMEESAYCKAYLYLQPEGVDDNDQQLDVYRITFPVPDGLLCIEVEGKGIVIPENYESFLIAAYGNSWRVPDEGYRHQDYWERVSDEKGQQVLSIR